MRNLKVYFKVIIAAITSSLVLTTGCSDKTSTVYIDRFKISEEDSTNLKKEAEKQTKEYLEQTTEYIIDKTEPVLLETTLEIENNTNPIIVETIQETEPETSKIEIPSETEKSLEVYEPSNDLEGEEEVIGFLEGISNKIDEWALEEKFENVKEDVTSGLATFILFMSGDSTIGGYTFSSLTEAGKQKVEILFIKMDTALENKFPGYKEKIGEKWTVIKIFVSEKYNDIKNKVRNYIISEVGEDLYEETLENFSSGWSDIKDSFSNVFGFIGDKIEDAKDDVVDWAKEKESEKEKVKK